MTVPLMQRWSAQGLRRAHRAEPGCCAWRRRESSPWLALTRPTCVFGGRFLRPPCLSPSWSLQLAAHALCIVAAPATLAHTHSAHPQNGVPPYNAAPPSTTLVARGFALVAIMSLCNPSALDTRQPRRSSSRSPSSAVSLEAAPRILCALITTDTQILPPPPTPPLVFLLLNSLCPPPRHTPGWLISLSLTPLCPIGRSTRPSRAAHVASHKARSFPLTC